MERTDRARNSSNHEALADKMDDEINIIRGDNQRLRERLERDALDTVIYLEASFHLHCVRLAVLIPYAWSERRSCLCDVVDMWTGRSDVVNGAREILEHLGWKFAAGIDAADYLEFCSTGLSAHRRLAGVRRIRNLFDA